MRKIVLFLLLATLSLVISGQNVCLLDDWTTSFDSEGVSKCSDDQTYIQGFERSARKDTDGIGLLEYAQCCFGSQISENKSPTTQTADWTLVLDNNNQWATCPEGYFLQGLSRSGSWPGLIYNIEQGLCAKPFGHPESYRRCYDQDIKECFKNEAFCSCDDDYSVAGIYRGGCDQLYCLETLKCCSMA